MKKCVVDLDEVKRLALEYEEDNWTFRSYVKGWLDWSDMRFDNLVHRIVREVSAQIDCTQCANCCLSMGPEVSGAEMEHLAPLLGLTAEEFEVRHTGMDEGERVIKTRPCPFLHNKSCSIYELRPQNCREYPHLLKQNNRSRMIQMLFNTEICPIVFNTVERLKVELPDWRKR